ncbi:MAG: arsenic efflux protein [Bacilli bacterium]|nr:arsenic efflux protein [Bacilli bacterium]
MLDIIADTLLDSLKLLPFLFLTFIIMELFEHKLGNKANERLKKANKVGPLFGSLLAVIPQCGISASATNFYITRVISLGTLISVYLSTSDEMLPILISEKVDISIILKFLAIKVVIGMICGFVIDFIYRNKKKEDIHEFCNDEHCDCEHGILKSSIKHTLNVIIYIIIFSFLLNIILHYYGESFLEKILMKNSPFGVFISSLIGLIPNCSSSIILTELYLKGLLSFGKVMAGLLVNAGVGLLILVKYNKDKKDTIKIIGILLIIGIISGLLLDIFIK